MTTTDPTVLAATGATPIALAALVAGALMALALALLFMTRDRRGHLEQRLGEYGVAQADDIEEFDPLVREDPVLAETAVMKRMVGITGRLADRAGLLTRTEDALEQADLPLRPPEALFFYFAAVVTLAVFGFLLLPLGLAFVLVAVATILPVAFLHRRRTKRLRNFQLQLPDTLNLLSGSMRAGFSFAQGLESVANEATEPTRRELQRVFTESRLGRPIEDALEDSANRMASVDLMWAVMAIRIQREVGGNLAELLDTVADTMSQRERIRLEIKALTAEGRFSGWVLGIFPIAFAGVLYMVQPDYISTLFANTFGIMALIASGVMTFFGFIWLRKILQIEVCDVTPIMIALVLAAAVAALTFVFGTASAERADVRESLRRLEGYQIQDVRDQEMLVPITERVFAPLFDGLTGVARRFTPTGFGEGVAQKLVLAGSPPNLNVDKVLVFKLLGLISIIVWAPLVLALGMFHGILAIVVIVGLWGCSFMYPDVMVNRIIEDRQKQISRKLPDILDLLVISVEAGLGFEQALDRTCTAVPGALSDEFRRMLHEIRIGASRADALRAMAERTDVPDLRAFILAMLQADTFGVSISRLLRAQADEMRTRRRLRAQEQAQKAPVKMLFPLVFCIFPSIFVVILGPAMIQISQSL